MTSAGQLNDPSTTDEKILAVLERIGQVLKTSAWKTGRPLLLNPAQTQLLVFLSNKSTAHHQVTGLARQFQVSKASMSDTLRALEQRQLLCRMPGNRPGQKIVGLTEFGRQTAQKVIRYTEPLLSALKMLQNEERGLLYQTLSDLVSALHRSGFIPQQRMCQTCLHYRQPGSARYCSLLDQVLGPESLQIDCPEHVPA
ncbi:MarR family winged helix-turn-helix transcriptional regulator [Pedobacter sp. SYP-B3415]|uniref:MarR family winged helix-turn-helix transcriptional regulator n=1 Tax=Pedobacter sp. SYP-B3415 TaxID=2496641 RepID=UPI0013EB8714|nr:MarR family transcriptional regulator [Pedobacter sp. SYP-B3415]